MKRADVIIIGGGVIGSASAYYLAKRGKRVIQLERDYFSAGASGSCDQMVIPQSKAPNEHLTLALYSVELYKGLSRELGVDIEYHQKGAMILIETQEELRIMEGITQKQRELGLPVELLSPAEAKGRQPGVNDGIITGSTYCPVDGEVNPFKMNLAYTDAAARLGAEIRPYTPVTGLIREGDRVVGVEVPGERLYADTVVNAAGAWVPVIGRMAGLELPIKPRRGQVYITEAVAPFVRHCVLNARYIVAKHNPASLANDTSRMAKLGVGISLTQSQKGNILFGATREFVGYDTGNSYEGLQEVLANAVRLMPGLRGMRIIRTMGGVRPYPPDSKPLIGYVKEAPGLFLAAGHEGDGICLAPASGLLVSQLICDGRSDIPAAGSFDPGRFRLQTS